MYFLFLLYTVMYECGGELMRNGGIFNSLHLTADDEVESGVIIGIGRETAFSVPGVRFFCDLRLTITYN